MSDLAAPVGAHLAGTLLARSCAQCSHAHRISASNGGISVTVDTACPECGCVASGDSYERNAVSAASSCAVHHLPGRCAELGWMGARGTVRDGRRLVDAWSRLQRRLGHDRRQLGGVRGPGVRPDSGFSDGSRADDSGEPRRGAPVDGHPAGGLLGLVSGQCAQRRHCTCLDDVDCRCVCHTPDGVMVVEEAS